jgi:hypothetical protein
MQSLPKSLFFVVFCLPLAIVLGVLLATPLDQTTLIVVLSGFLLLLTPFFLTSHHAILIFSWNAFVTAFFLPGKPFLWMLMTAVSVFFIVLTKTLNREKMRLLLVPSITWPLLALGLVTVVTAQFTGGVGLSAVGSDMYGGKRYIYEWTGIAGFFAISAIPIDPARRQFIAAGFFLSAITAFASNIAYMLGESFYFLFLLFPVEAAITQLVSETSISGGFSRVAGLSPASLGIVCFVLMRYGIRGICNFKRPWRIVLFALTILAGLFSGFRGTLVLFMMLIVGQFFAEGLHRTKYMFVAISAVLLLSFAVLPFANRLPLSVQRCLTVLPLDLDQAAVQNAQGTSDWRLEMWRALLPDVKTYFWFGKGYGLDPKDLYFAQEHISRRIGAGYESAMIAGDYHNGPLTLIIPFGIWGVLAFAWFAVAALRVLWRNYQYGDPDVQNINRFLFVAFNVHLIFFLLVFGCFYVDLVRFVGFVALSIAINHGVASRSMAPVPARELEPEPEPQTAFGGRLQPAFRAGRA